MAYCDSERASYTREITPVQARPSYSVTGPKAGRILDLYARRFEGKALGGNDFVVSADEKPSIQARCRCHPTLPPATSRAMRVEHEYERGGALQYLAAWDVHRAKVFGRCEAQAGIDPFGPLVAQVMNTEPYASARRVFWVVDNGSSHRGQASVERLESTYTTKRGRRRLRLIHCPAALIVAEPGGDLLIHHPAQGAHPQRLRGPGGGGAPPPGLRAALRGGGHAVRVEVHPPGSAGSHGPAAGKGASPGSLTGQLQLEYVSELMGLTT
jgi:hypothetical protein